MSLNNYNSSLYTVENKIKEIFDKQKRGEFQLEDFSYIGKYKPDKQNVAMQIFADRMAENPDCKPPKPYEPFTYVKVKKYPFKYDDRGRAIPLKQGDIMEYIDYARKHNMEIDMKTYMESGITKQFARFITFMFSNETPREKMLGFFNDNIEDLQSKSDDNNEDLQSKSNNNLESKLNNNIEDLTYIFIKYFGANKNETSIKYHNIFDDVKGSTNQNLSLKKKEYTYNFDEEDENEIKAATKHLETIIDRYTNSYKSKGSLYQKVFRSVNSTVSKVSNVDSLIGMKPSVKIKKSINNENNENESGTISLNEIIDNIKVEQEKLSDEYIYKFLHQYCKNAGKTTTTPTKDMMFKLHSYYGNNKKYVSTKNYLLSKENIILKELDRFKYEIEMISKKKLNLVNKYNNKLRQLLNLDEIIIYQTDTLPNYDDLITDKTLYNSIINEMNIESENLITNDDEVILHYFNIKLIELKSVIFTKNKYDKLKDYILTYLQNNTVKKIMKSFDIENAAESIANNLTF